MRQPSSHKAPTKPGDGLRTTGKSSKAESRKLKWDRGTTGGRRTEDRGTGSEVGRTESETVHLRVRYGGWKEKGTKATSVRHQSPEVGLNCARDKWIDRRGLADTSNPSPAASLQPPLVRDPQHGRGPAGPRLDGSAGLAIFHPLQRRS